jgi:hypothetical protein
MAKNPHKLCRRSREISDITGLLLGYRRWLANAPQPVNLPAALKERIGRVIRESVAIEIRAENELLWPMLRKLSNPISLARGDAAARSRAVIARAVEVIAEASPETAIMPADVPASTFRIQFESCMHAS